MGSIAKLTLASIKTSTSIKQNNNNNVSDEMNLSSSIMHDVGGGNEQTEGQRN